MLALVGLLFSAQREPVWAADDLSHKRSQLESRIADAQDQRDDLESALEDLSGQLALTQTEIQQIDGRITVAQAGVDAATAALTGAQREQRVIAEQLADAQRQEAAITQQVAGGAAQQQRLRQAVGAMARGAYRAPSVAGLSVLLDSNSAADVVDGYADVATAQRIQAQLYERVQRLQADARNRGARLGAVQQTTSGLERQADEKIVEADAARNAAVAAKAALDGLRNQQQTRQETVRSQMAEAQRQVDEADASTATMQAQLKQVIEAQGRQATATKTTSTPGSAARGALFANPTANQPMYVTSEFGMRLQPVLGTYRLHAGIDLRDYCGQPVYAGRDGTVVWSKYLSGYGNQVMLDHGTVDGKSLVSGYSHLTRSVVAAGQQVKAGQIVGYAGQTGGVSTGCHLHFEVYVDGTVLNPRPYLGLPPA
jgi:murein DD-endopeptidase MepM/ murein hydrolase activator NlpD